MRTLRKASARQRYQDILLCRVVRGMSQSETAKHLGVSVKTVKRADAIRKAQSPAK